MNILFTGLIAKKGKEWIDSEIVIYVERIGPVYLGDLTVRDIINTPISYEPYSGDRISYFGKSGKRLKRAMEILKSRNINVSGFIDEFDPIRSVYKYVSDISNITDYYAIPCIDAVKIEYGFCIKFPVSNSRGKTIEDMDIMIEDIDGNRIFMQGITLKKLRTVRRNNTTAAIPIVLNNSICRWSYYITALLMNGLNYNNTNYFSILDLYEIAETEYIAYKLYVKSVNPNYVYQDVMIDRYIDIVNRIANNDVDISEKLPVLLYREKHNEKNVRAIFNYWPGIINSSYNYGFPEDTNFNSMEEFTINNYSYHMIQSEPLDDCKVNLSKEKIKRKMFVIIANSLASIDMNGIPNEKRINDVVESLFRDPQIIYQ